MTRLCGSLPRWPWFCNTAAAADLRRAIRGPRVCTRARGALLPAPPRDRPAQCADARPARAGDASRPSARPAPTPQRAPRGPLPPRPRQRLRTLPPAIPLPLLQPVAVYAGLQGPHRMNPSIDQLQPCVRHKLFISALRTLLCPFSPAARLGGS